MNTSYMIGVDIGTTSTKAVLFEENGRIAAQSNQGYLLHQPSPSVAEQDPEQIMNAVTQTIAAVMRDSAVPAEAVLFVSFSSAMHSVIAVDNTGKPLTACITWADNRSAACAARLKNELGGMNYICVQEPLFIRCPRSPS